MIGTLNSWVSKVVGTVSAPFYGKEAKVAKPAKAKVAKAKKTVKRSRRK